MKLVSIAHLDGFYYKPRIDEEILEKYANVLVNFALGSGEGIKKGDVMIGRPMGMSCGCPVTHCGVVSDVDARNGVIYWNVTGPLRPRSAGW